MTLADWPELDVAALLPVQLLELVEALPVGDADDRAGLGAVAACEHLLRHVGALQLRYLARAVQVCENAAARAGAGAEVFSGVELISAQIGPLFGLSRRSATNKVSRACNLVDDLPRLLELVEAGSLDLQRATAVDDVMREVLHPDDDAWAGVQEVIAARAPGCSNRWLRELTRRAITHADPAAAGRRHDRAVIRRQVVIDPLPDAMALVGATLRADQAQLVDTVLDALADGCREHHRAAGTTDGRTHEQRRADAFVALFCSVATGTPVAIVSGPASATDDALFGGQLRTADPTEAGVLGWWVPPVLPRQQGRRPQITVTMPLSTLTGAGDGAADLAGYGPIPAGLARAVAAEAGRYRLVVLPDEPVPAGPAPDGSGHHGPGDQQRCTNTDRAYRPRQSLVDQVVAFHQVCRHPHCARRAGRCDVDHVNAYPEGPTCECKQTPSDTVPWHSVQNCGSWRFVTALRHVSNLTNIKMRDVARVLVDAHDGTLSPDDRAVALTVAEALPTAVRRTRQPRHPAPAFVASAQPASAAGVR